MQNVSCNRAWITGVRTGGMRECRGQPVWGELDGTPWRGPKIRASTPQFESCDWWTRRRRAWEGGAQTLPTMSHT